MKINYIDGKRIFYLDVLRAIAILGVILSHATQIFGTINPESLRLSIPGLINVFGLVGVPLFFMLSGVLLLNRDYTIPDFLKKRFTRILYPAIFWIALSAVIFLIALPEINISKMIFGENFYTWFIWVMIGIYLITPILNAYVKVYKMTGVKYFIAIWFVTIILKTFNLYPFKMLELSYFAGYIGFLALGYYLANYDFKMSNITMCLTGALMYIIFSLITMFIRFKGLSINTGYNSITIVLAGAGVFLFIMGLSQYLDKNNYDLHYKIKTGIISKLVFTLSACSYGMYFTNKIFINIIKQHFATPSVKLYPLMYLLIVVLSVVSVLIVSKIPKLKTVSGVA